MTELMDDNERLLADLEQEFMQSATPIEAASGRAWHGQVAIYTFVAEHAADEDEDAAWEILEVHVLEPSETLVQLAVRNPGPPDWDWSLNSLRIGDRGYIWMMHEAAYDEPCLPMFAAWEPYDDQQAFETAFIAGHSNKLWEFIGVGTHYQRGERVSADLWERSLRTALDDNKSWEALDTGPTDTPEQREAALRRYLTEREGV